MRPAQAAAHSHAQWQAMRRGKRGAQPGPCRHAADLCRTNQAYNAKASKTQGNPRSESARGRKPPSSSRAGAAP